MSRTKKINDQELLVRLFQLFREYGYDGASLAHLAEASGLKKASLYHRFPGGKEEMAEEVLTYTNHWIKKYIVEPLQEVESPEKKVKLFSHQVGRLYNNGNESCLLNMLSPATQSGCSFTQPIKAAMQLLITTLTEISQEAGFGAKEASKRAEQVLVEIQGALVVCRGLANGAPFKRMQKRLPGILLAEK